MPFLFLLFLLSLLLTLKLRLDFGAAAVESDLADIQALRQELAQAQAALEERVTRAELQDSVQELPPTPAIWKFRFYMQIYVILHP